MKKLLIGVLFFSAITSLNSTAIDKFTLAPQGKVYICFSRTAKVYHNTKVVEDFPIAGMRLLG
jgi:hypothetical protein